MAGTPEGCVSERWSPLQQIILKEKQQQQKKVFIHNDCCEGKIIRPNYAHESKVLPRNASQMLKNGKYELSFLGFRARIYISH